MKTIVKNQVGSKMFTVTLPAPAASVKSFCDTFLVGTYDVFELANSGGTSAPVMAYKKALIRISNPVTKESCYLGFCIPSTKNEVDIKTALLGKTFNGIKADEIYVKFDSIVSLEQLQSVSVAPVSDAPVESVEPDSGSKKKL